MWQEAEQWSIRDEQCVLIMTNKWRKPDFGNDLELKIFPINNVIRINLEKKINKSWKNIKFSRSFWGTVTWCEKVPNCRPTKAMNTEGVFMQFIYADVKHTLWDPLEKSLSIQFQSKEVCKFASQVCFGVQESTTDTQSTQTVAIRHKKNKIAQINTNIGSKFSSVIH